MAGKTVTRADLSEAVYQEVGLSRNESAELVEAVLNEIADHLVKGNSVKISSFGSFSVRQKGSRMRRNPKTGTRVEVPAKRIPYFKPSKELKDLVNDEEHAGSPAPASEPGPAPTA